MQDATALTNTMIVKHLRLMPVAELVRLTTMLLREAAVESPAFRHVQDRPLRALEHEQDRRAVANPAVAYDLAHLARRYPTFRR